MQADVTSRACVVRFPADHRPLPTPADLDRVAALPLVQLFVVGRSGSGLIHAFLDSHPAVLHVPHTFKFYDFVAANPDVTSLTPQQAAERFAGSPLVKVLFDSSLSMIIGGRLGDDQQTVVAIDKERFAAAFVSVVGARVLTERMMFLAIVLAYGWCIGQDAATVRVVLHHVHHGDWLWPERLIEAGNYHTPLNKPPPAILKADRYLLSVREPHDAMASMLRFVVTAGFRGAERVQAQEQYLRLLIQDWTRLRWVDSQQLDMHIVRLEDLRVDALGAMRTCAGWLGIDDTDPALAQLSYYGFAWHGDVFTTASREVHRASRPHQLPWQDRWLVDATIADVAARHGYRHSPGALDRVMQRLLQPLTIAWPSPSLRREDLLDVDAADEARRAASDRVTFVERVRAAA